MSRGLSWRAHRRRHDDTLPSERKACQVSHASRSLGAPSGRPAAAHSQLALAQCRRRRSNDNTRPAGAAKLDFVEAKSLFVRPRGRIAFPGGLFSSRHTRRRRRRPNVAGRDRRPLCVDDGRRRLSLARANWSREWQYQQGRLSARASLLISRRLVPEWPLYCVSSQARALSQRAQCCLAAAALAPNSLAESRRYAGGGETNANRWRCSCFVSLVPFK
jgi:hypothetical protein